MTPRRFVLAGAAALALLPRHAAADDSALAAAIREAVGDANPVEGGIELRVPPVAENGAQVPLTVLVDSPMTESDHVAAIHVFATRNPTPGVASFHLFPGLARAEVQTRIRVAEEQAIIALAVHANGTVRRASATLKVTRGGCLS
jgi:sulfur-oxidizing protein SoxY